MRTIVGICLAALLLGLGLAACGGSGEGYLSTPTVRAALQEAGFSHLRVASQKSAAKQLNRLAGRVDVSPDEVLDEDMISAPFRDGWPTLMAARLPSSAMAKKAFERGYSAKELSRGIADLRKQGGLPKGFARDKIRAARVCNVIMWAYNADRDPRVTASFDRAVRLLQARC